MFFPFQHKYPQNTIPGLRHESDYFEQSLESVQSSSSSLDSIGSQSEASLSVAGSSLDWFNDFIQYDSYDHSFQADLKRVSETSESVRMKLIGDVATMPLFTSSPGVVPISTDTFVPKDTCFRGRLHSTGLDEANSTVAFDSNMQDLQWNAAEPALNLDACNDSESAHGEDTQKLSLAHSTSVQNKTMGKSTLVRMRYFYCTTCRYPCISEFRLRYVLLNYRRLSLLTMPSEHVRKYHPPVQYICNICYRGFTTNKDLRRHELIHESSRQSFACSCGKTYSRNDKLKRHITNMVQKPREAGHHTAV